MANNYEIDSTLEGVTVRGEAAKRNFRKLPKVKYFKVQSRGAVGTMDNRKDRKVGAWAVLVSCDDGKGLRLVTDVAYEHGMIVKGEFVHKEQAFAAAMEYKAKWGAVTAKGKKEQEKQAEIDKRVSEAVAAEQRKNEERILQILATLPKEQAEKVLAAIAK